jgi:benzoylformate decarboxylase
VGVPGAIGISVAQPDSLVIGFSGDGGSMYTIQALWSAVRHNVNTKFVICNNGAYKLLDLNISHYWSEREISEHDFPIPFDLSFPPLRFDMISESMGVPAIRVETHDQIAPAIDQMLASNGPFLIDLVLANDSKPDIVNHLCGS